jgi:sugar phosphate isomerase/epimerase
MKQTDKKWELSFYTDLISFNGKHFFDEKNILAKWQPLKVAGINWIGINGINLFEEFEPSQEKVLSLATKMLKSSGVQISSLHYSGPVFSMRQKSQSIIRKKLVEYVETFNEWKPLSIVIHAGMPMLENGENDIVESFKRNKAEHGLEAIMNNVTENLKEMGKVASEYNIKLAIENTGRFLPLGDLTTLPKLVAKIDEDNVGYCLDSGHAHAFGENIVEWIDIMGNKLFETHFHDNRVLAKDRHDEFISPTNLEGHKKIDEHMFPGFGTIPWIDVIQALSKSNFTGPITFECEGWPDADKELGYQNAINWWHACERLALAI